GLEALLELAHLGAQALGGLAAEGVELGLEALAGVLPLLLQGGRLGGQPAAELLGVRKLDRQPLAGLGELGPYPLDLGQEAAEVAVLAPQPLLGAVEPRGGE